MRTRMVLIRHGDSVHKMKRVIGGPQACEGLTPLGHQQATQVASHLAAQASDWGPIAVYSSTLRRAKETAGPIAARFGVPAGTHCGLCTWHIPPYADGMPVDELWRDHTVEGGGVFRPFERDNETWAELVNRVSRALVDIGSRHRGGTVIVVGHAETVAASFGGLGMLGHYYPFELAPAQNAAITEWVTDDDPTRFPPARWTLVRFNDAS